MPVGFYIGSKPCALAMLDVEALCAAVKLLA